MYYTGAIKNLFGLIPGIQKSAFHLRFPGRPDFAAMLADLALATRPDFALMDAIVAMEGPGPNSGKPKRLDLLLASRDSLALDWTAAELIGYEAGRIPYLAELLAREGSPFIADPAEIERTGVPFADARPERFEILPIVHDPDFFRRRVPAFAHRLLKDFLVARPSFDHRACIRCGGCVRICPAGALEIRAAAGGGKRVEIDYDTCIRCYCCHEICPEDAIDLVKGPRFGGGSRGRRAAAGTPTATPPPPGDDDGGPRD
jgi:ferredoxin